jgi:hypothetical protein
MKNSLKTYLEYIDSDIDFTSQVRLEYKWDDSNYQVFINLLMDVVNDYKNDQLIPIPVMYFFVSGINYLIGTIENPLFLNNINDEKKEIIERRTKELIDLRSKFNTGELFQL